jgi:hypothetical protein
MNQVVNTAGLAAMKTVIITANTPNVPSAARLSRTKRRSG